MQTNKPNRQEDQMFSTQGIQKCFCPVVSEVQEKTEIEIEVLIAITEAALSIDETITKVERVRQHREVRAEAEKDRTRVVPTSQRQR